MTITRYFGWVRVGLPHRKCFDTFDEQYHVFYWNLWKNPVTQIKDVPRAVGRLQENVTGRFPDMVFLCQQHHRVQISHDSAIFPNGGPCRIKIDPPIDTDYIATRFG